MKVLILGAAGKAGRAALAAIRNLPGVEQVFLADHDAEGLAKMATLPAPFPIRLRYLEAHHPRDLRERLREADLVLGCVGPFHLHEEEIFRAVVETGRDYLTLCDDAGVTEEALSRQEQAAAGGSRVLLGCGMAPGLSNLLALRAASLLDRVERLGFFWRLEALSSLGSATLHHLAHSLAGKAKIVKGGSESRVRAGGWPEMVDFPPPAGPAVLSFLRRPEPLTLTRAVKGAGEVFFKAGIGGRAEDFLLHALSRLGEEGYAEVLLNLLGLTGGRARGAAGEGRCPTCLRVTAEGTRGGRPFRVHLAAAGDYYRVTGMMVAASVSWLRDLDPPPGVYSPEEGPDPLRALPFLRASGARFFMAEEPLA